MLEAHRHLDQMAQAIARFNEQLGDAVPVEARNALVTAFGNTLLQRAASERWMHEFTETLLSDVPDISEA